MVFIMTLYVYALNPPSPSHPPPTPRPPPAEVSLSTKPPIGRQASSPADAALCLTVSRIMVTPLQVHSVFREQREGDTIGRFKKHSI